MMFPLTKAGLGVSSKEWSVPLWETFEVIDALQCHSPFSTGGTGGKMHQHSSSPDVVVPSGIYVIGSNTIPNAGPRHERQLAEPVSIDSFPVTWNDFEVFVTKGGFEESELWHGFDSKRPMSVDSRCRELFENTWKTGEVMFGNSWPMRQRPLCGTTWFEAVAISRFFGARLPFEVEWEAAMSGLQHSHSSRTRDPHSRFFPRSQTGCVIFAGYLQEWTCDVFSPRYWRSDQLTPGAEWTQDSPNASVTVRGSLPTDVHRTICWRIGTAPTATHPRRTFRRAMATIEQ